MRRKLLEVLQKSAPGVSDISVTIPENESHGHYSTNVAFRLAKEQKISPVEAGQKLKEKIMEQDGGKLFEKIDVVIPGFMNFWVRKDAWHRELGNILKQKEKYGSEKKKNEKINLEFISANPTGPLTMANARGGFLGDVLANTLSFSGYKVIREYYINDAGNQIKILGASVLAAAGRIQKEETHYQGEYIKTFAKKYAARVKKIPDDGLEAAKTEIGEAVAAELLAEIKKSVVKAGIRFDVWRSEKKDIRGKKLAEKLFAKLKKKDLLTEHDGAVWLKAGVVQEKERVVKKSDGDYTYYPVDLAYHMEKLSKCDKAIDIWGTDHHGNVAPIKAGLALMGADSKKLTIILMQLVRLVKNGKEVKISKRAGNFVLLDDLLKEVPLDATRFFFALVSPDTHMDFDLALAKERSMKNPVYYVQYAYVRCGAILRKTKNLKPAFGEARYGRLKTKKGRADVRLLQSNIDLALMRALAQFPGVVEEISATYQIHHLARYAMDLARVFQGFYEKERIVGEKDKKLAAARLVLVEASRIVLGNTLNLLGVSKPEKM